MENIGNFLTVAQSLGVAKIDLFQTVDLYEAQNLPGVIYFSLYEIFLFYKTSKISVQVCNFVAKFKSLYCNCKRSLGLVRDTIKCFVYKPVCA